MVSSSPLMYSRRMVDQSCLAARPLGLRGGLGVVVVVVLGLTGLGVFWLRFPALVAGGFCACLVVLVCGSGVGVEVLAPLVWGLGLLLGSLAGPGIGHLLYRSDVIWIEIVKWLVLALVAGVAGNAAYDATKRATALALDWFADTKARESSISESRLRDSMLLYLNCLNIIGFSLAILGSFPLMLWFALRRVGLIDLETQNQAMFYNISSIGFAFIAGCTWISSYYLFRLTLKAHEIRARTISEPIPD